MRYGKHNKRINFPICRPYGPNAALYLDPYKYDGPNGPRQAWAITLDSLSSFLEFLLMLLSG